VQRRETLARRHPLSGQIEVIRNAVKEVKMQERSNDLKDMVVLVVGCGTPGGIGSAIAQALADAGAALVLADLATSKLVAVGQELVEQGHRVLTQAVDLVSENSVEELVSFA
jgi:NAD(P)-dependent dehydrogenase (short-subunit alcohol dehydrogenase family)